MWHSCYQDPQEIKENDGNVPSRDVKDSEKRLLDILYPDQRQKLPWSILNPLSKFHGNLFSSFLRNPANKPANQLMDTGEKQNVLGGGSKIQIKVGKILFFI